MRLIDEAAFREALDGRGIVREGALTPPTRDEAFTVFAQQADARIAIDEWKNHAARFLATRIGLTVDKRYEDDGPQVDAARVVVAPSKEASETRMIWGRPRTDDDLRAAEAADGGAGLALLAKRCGVVWLVACERTDDRIALRLATIIAGVALGPILAPPAAGRAPSLFGPKTARVTLGD